MSVVIENVDEFDRHSCRYKQFKVSNTRRTSTPQLLVRPKHIRRNIHCDAYLPPSSLQPPSRCPDVDTTYVSYVQWRHFLVVPNSARNFKVRCTGKGCSIPITTSDTIISGNIHMLPYPHPQTTSTPSKGFSKLKKQFALQQKTLKEARVEELLNSRIVENNHMAEYRERLERRNQRIVDIVMPLIKKSLKRFFVCEPGVRMNVEPVKSKSAKIFSGLTDTLRLRKDRGDMSEDREYLIDINDNVEIEE